MRDTSKLLAAALLTICVALLGAAAAATAAAAGGSVRPGHHHRSRGCRRHHPKSCGSGAARHTHVTTTPRSAKPSHAAKPSAPAKPAAAPKPVREQTGHVPGHKRVQASEEEVEGEQEESPAARAAAISATLATPCQETEITPTSENLAAVRAAVLCLINRERAENGVEPLRLNADLGTAAEGHCAELIADDYFAHVAPDGETPVQRIERTGYIPSPADGYVIGENLAWGTYQLSTPQSIVAAWIASPGHLANILEARYTETGIGVTPAVPQSLGEGNPGATYAQEFGVIVK